MRYLYLTDSDGRLSGIVTLNQLIVSDQSQKLDEIANKNLVTASPEDDQEDVARNIAKYNLLAMPVVSDDQRLLGIVTVDDALDVLEEEHAEDLQIAGGSSDSEGSERSRDVIWFFHRNVWIFFWIIATGVASAAAAAFFNTSIAPTLVFFTCLAMPVALILADDTISYVTNFFLEDDPGSEDSPSILGFGFRSLLLGLLVSGVTAALGAGLDAVIMNWLINVPAGVTIHHVVISAFGAATISTLLSFLLTPVYLSVLRHRDEKNQETSGFALSLTSMAIAVVTYLAAAGGLFVLQTVAGTVL